MAGRDGRGTVTGPVTSGDRPHEDVEGVRNTLDRLAERLREAAP